MQKGKERWHLASARSVLRIYSGHIFKHPIFLLLVILGGFLLQGANIAAPLFLRRFFNTLAAGVQTTEVVWTLFGILGVVVSMWFLDWAARRVQDVANMYMQSWIMPRLFTDSFSYLIRHSHNFFTSHFAGSLTHKVTKFSRAFEVLADSILLQFFPTFLFVSGAVVVLFMRSPWLGLALGLWSICFVWFQVYVAKKRQPLRIARSEADTKITATLADAISNHSAILLFSGFHHESGILGAVVERWRKATLRSWLADAWVWSLIGLFMIAIEGGLLGGAVLLWREGVLTIGDFVLIQAYLLVVFDRLVTINRELRRFYDTLADAQEMVYLLELPHEVVDAPQAKALTVPQGEIRFDDVSFRFYANHPILENFDLRIAGREKVALVGPSGAGKSTVMRLLFRLYDVKKGEISIDGQNIAEVTQESLHDAIAFVPQEPVLFHRTLMENIRYGRREATDEEVIGAAKLAHCHEFITKFPDGYETYVGERGVKLSGGERQRVAIARAILKNAPVLVLDEATSSLDSESESYIQDALEVLMRGKTVIVIAHRLSTIMKMDRIVVIQEGQIVDQGTHQELLAKESLYKKLWEIQAGGFIAD